MRAIGHSPSDLSALFDSLAAPFDAAMVRCGRRDDFLTIAGVRFRIASAGPIRERLLPALATEPPEWSDDCSDGRSAAEITLLLWDAASAGLPRPNVPWRSDDIGPRGEIALATSASIRTAFMAGSSALSMLDLDRGVGLFHCPDAASLPWYERAAPLRTLLHWALAARSHRLVHAAAVATPRGGALLAGRGGSGKSTTAMLCLERGFLYAGDDYVAITGDDVPRAHALFTSAKLSESCLSWLPFLDGAIRIRSTADSKAVAMLGEIRPRQLAASFPLAALIVPRVAGGTSRIERMGGGAALRALAPTTILQLPGNGAETLEELAGLVRRLPAWSLQLGDDRGSVPDLIARAIDESAGPLEHR